jgi:ankyrin repeat protein
LNEIPALPPRPQFFDPFRANLSESLVHAVETGNVELVDAVMKDSNMRSMLTFQEHAPRMEPPGAMAHMHMLNGETPPVQPKFGLGTLIWCRGRRPDRKDLLSLACRHGQVAVASKLLEFGLDVNGLDVTDDLSFHQPSSEFSTLMIAIAENEKLDMVRFLLDQPNLVLTNHKIRVCRPRNGRSRPRCDSTALSMAADKGSVPIVQLLTDRGAFDMRSMSRPDDPHSSEHCGQSDAEERVKLSINEALCKAHQRFHAFTKTHADLLELLLPHTGAHPMSENVIATCILDPIENNSWTEIDHNGCRCQLSEDHDFVPEDHNVLCGQGENPSLRALAIARGLRHLSPECFKAAGIMLSEEGIQRLKDKHKEWNRIVALSLERMETEHDDCLLLKQGCASLSCGTLGDRVSEDSREASQQMCQMRPDLDVSRRRHQMLLWCQLIRDTSRPCLARELLSIGSALARTHNSGFLKDIWEREIMPSMLS